MFSCQECGRKFKTAKAAERAANRGCPGCGGVDIDIGSYEEREEKARKELFDCDGNGPEDSTDIRVGINESLWERRQMGLTAL